MQEALIALGVIFIIIGVPLGLYRIKNYKNRVGNPDVYQVPGAIPGSLPDKIFYIGTAFLFALVGVFFIVQAVTGDWS